jgi:hypothetical protein
MACAGQLRVCGDVRVNVDDEEINLIVEGANGL